MSRESCCILNLSKADVRCRLTLYFPDAEPVRGIEVTVGAERRRHVRFDRADELAGARAARRTGRPRRRERLQRCLAALAPG